MKQFLVAALSSLPLLVQAQALDPNANQEPPSWADRPLEEITVTGKTPDKFSNQQTSFSKSDIEQLQLAQTVTVLNQTFIDEQQLKSLSQALSNVSGVVPNAESETVLVNPIVRGFESEIFIDGLIGYGDSATIDPSSLVGFEKIEVAKGPTSTLYGGGTGAPVGGLINLVSKTPVPERFTEVNVRLGDFDTRAVSVDTNVPLSDKVAFRIAAEDFSSDDYIDDVTIERVSVYPSLTANLSDDTQITLRSFYTKVEQLEYPGLPAQVTDVDGVDPLQFTGAADTPRTSVENTAVDLELKHQFSESLSGTVKTRYFENSFDEFATTPFLSFFPIVDTAAPIIVGNLPIDVQETTIDAYLNWTSNQTKVSHNVVLGITLDDTDYEGGSIFDFNPIGVLDYTQPNTLAYRDAQGVFSDAVNEYTTAAVYLQDHISINERLFLLLSGRLSRYSIEERGTFVFGKTSDASFTEFDPRLGITYQFTPDVSLFAAYSTGSRLSIFFDNTGNDVVPEESESIEAGLKFELSELGLSGGITAFDLSRTNIPATNPTTLLLEQVGEQESRGVELDLIWEPNEALSVLASFSHVNATLVDDITSFGTNFVAGNQLARVPERSARLVGRYRVSGGPLAGLGLSLGLTYADEAPLTDTNEFFSDSYTIFDAQLSYQLNDSISSVVSIRNLTNKDYFVPYQYLQQNVVRPGEPRAAFINFKMRF